MPFNYSSRDVNMFSGLLFLVCLAAIIFLESRILKKKNLPKYDWKEIRISILFIIALFFLSPVWYVPNMYLSNVLYPYRITTFEMNKWSDFLIFFLLTEFCHYWMHRYSHTIKLGWASHSVHHAPKTVNLVTAHYSPLTNFFSLIWLTYTPLALLGFDPEIIYVWFILSAYYQIWLHTEIFPKIKYLDWVFNTPSLHRVHHGLHPDYVNKNYGAILIIFDRMFGTYQAEDPAIKRNYGLFDEPARNKFFSVVFHGWVQLFKQIKSESSWLQRIALPFQKTNRP